MSAHRDTWLQSVARWHRQRWRALWAAIVVVAVVSSLGALTYGERLKEMVTWGSPVLVENLADDSWQGRWRSIEGGFQRRDKCLVSTGSVLSVLVWPHQLWGPAAIQYDGEILADARPGDISVVWARSYDPARATDPLSEIYKFQVGAFYGSYSTITGPSGEHLASDDFRPVPGRRYRIRIEIQDYSMSLSVDGHVICTWTDTVRFDGGYFGLFACYPGKTFSNLRVENRPVAQKVTATAIGDAFMRIKLFPEAYAQYQRIADAYDGTAIGREALLKQGLCLWEQGRQTEALALWRRLDGSEYESLVRIYGIDHRFASHDPAGARSALEALYVGADGGMRKRIIMQWGHYVDSLRGQNDRLEVDRYLDVHDRLFPEARMVDANAAEALLYLQRYDDLLRLYPRQRVQCSQALQRSGRGHEVIERYPDQVEDYCTACYTTGEYALLEAKCPDDIRMDIVRTKRGHPEQALTESKPDPIGRSIALCAVGRLDEARTRSTPSWLNGMSPILAGREQEVASIDDPGLRASAQLYLGQARRRSNFYLPRRGKAPASASHARFAGMDRWRCRCSQAMGRYRAASHRARCLRGFHPRCSGAIPGKSTRSSGIRSVDRAFAPGSLERLSASMVHGPVCERGDRRR